PNSPEKTLRGVADAFAHSRCLKWTLLCSSRETRAHQGTTLGGHMNQSASTSNAHGKSIHLTRRVAILVTLWLALEPALFAWGPEGHRIVATIAFQLLPEAIKTQVE